MSISFAIPSDKRRVVLMMTNANNGADMNTEMPIRQISKTASLYSVIVTAGTPSEIAQYYVDGYKSAVRFATDKYANGCECRIMHDTAGWVAFFENGERRFLDSFRAE